MELFTLVVSYQYEENYAFSDGGEAWKKKGGHDVIIGKFTREQIFQWGDEIRNKIEELTPESNEACRYTPMNAHYFVLNEDAVDQVEEFILGHESTDRDYIRACFMNNVMFDYAVEILEKRDPDMYAIGGGFLH